MTAPVRWTALLIVLAGFLPAQDSLTLLNREALRNPTRPLLEQRQQLVEQLIRTDPDSLSAIAFTSAQIDRLKRALPGSESLLEESIEWDGVLEIRIEDDFEHRRSRTQWRIRTPGGRFEMFFGKDGPPPARAPGSPIRLRGIRSGASIAVRQLSLGSSSLPLATAAISGAQACSATGPQKIAVLKFTFPGSTAYPTGLNDSFFQQTWFGATGSSLNTYWHQTSYGKTSATGQVFGPFALSQSYTCAQTDAFEAAALQAASASVDLTQYTRFALLFPVPNCTFGGLGTLGCEKLPSSSQVASIVWIPLYSSDQTAYEFGIVAHEHGHNLGLDHANSVDYGPIPLGFLDNSGTNTEYGDPFSAMATSSSINGHNIVGQYPSEQTSLLLGWLQPSDYQEVRTAGIYNVVPYENTSGNRALRIQRDSATDAWLWLEYRQPIGIADTTLSFIPGSNVFNGALLHYDNPNLDSSHTYLVDFNPSATPNNFDTSALTPGQTWSDPASLLRLTVNTATSAGLSVSVGYDTACATAINPAFTFPASGLSGVLNIGAAAGCSWTVSTGTPWLSFPSATSGSGNGSVAFTIAATGSPAQRKGYLVLNRQSIPVTQNGTGTTIFGSSGSGASAQVSVNFVDPKGASDVSHADITFFGNPGCDVYVDVTGRAFFLLNDSASQFLGPILPGASGASLSNSQCTLLGSGSTIGVSGVSVSVGLHLTFSATFGGTRRILASVTSYGPLTVGSWTVPGPAVQVSVPNVTGLTQSAATNSITAATLTLGTITAASSGTVPYGSVISQNPIAGAQVNTGSAVNLVVSTGPAPVPSAVSVTPSSGSGTSQIFTAVYSDAVGAAALNRRLFLINSALSGSGACYVQADSTGVYLVNDAGNGLLGSSVGTPSNSQCTLNSAGTGVVNSGNNSTVALSIAFAPTFAGPKTIYMYAEDSAGNTGFLSRGTFTVLTSPPSAVSVSPTSGSGPTQTFTAIYSDPAGATALNRRLFLINSALNGAAACYVQTDSSGVYLVNDAGSALLGPLTANGTLANSQCTLNGPGTGKINSGNTSTVTLSITFKAAFAGPKNIYMYADDSFGNNSGFQTRGTFTPTLAIPTADSVTPSSASGTAQTFTAVYSDASGATTLNRRLFLINSSLNGAGACFVQADPTGIYLVNDAGSGLLGPVTGSATFTNNQCTLNGIDTTLNNSSSTSTLTVSLTFKPTFAGPKNIYMYADDPNRNNSGFQARGTYAVSSAVPTADSVNPSSSSGPAQTFTATYSDASGAAALNRRLFLVNSVLNGTNACFVQADPSGIYLVNDAGSALLGPLTGTATLSNSQCTLNGTGSSLNNSGSTSTITLSIAFKPAFSGAKNLYMYAEDTSANNSGFQLRGTFTVTSTASVPTVTSVTPNSGSGAHRPFTLVYSDPAGNSLLNRRLFLINSTLNGAGACFVEVDRNGIFLATDAGTGLIGPLLPNGSLGNSQCSVDTPGASVAYSATTTTVVLPITFKAPFGGSRNIYMYADDTLGNSSGWQLMGAVTAQ